MSRLDQLYKLRDADPTDADVPYMIAQEQAKAGDVTASIDWYDRCLELDPDYLYAYFHKAKMLESQDDLTIAVASLESGLDRAKRAGNAKAIGELGEYLTQLQERLRDAAEN